MLLLKNDEKSIDDNNYTGSMYPERFRSFSFNQNNLNNSNKQVLTNVSNIKSFNKDLESYIKVFNELL